MKNIFGSGVFWDTDLNMLNLENDRKFIISRVLEYGTIADTRKVFSIYGKGEVEETIRNSNSISRKTASFWAKILDIPVEEVNACSTLPRYLRKH